MTLRGGLCDLGSFHFYEVHKMALNNSPVMNSTNSIIVRMAEQFKVDPDKLWATLSQTCFKPEPNGRAFSPEEVMYVLMVAEQLGINPLRREIWAFRGKNGIVQPLVSVDGWKAIMLRQPNFDGFEIRYSDTTVDVHGVGAVPEWCECTIWLKGISHPTTERVYMTEAYVATSPVWRSRPRHMLHHRALIQAIRFSFPVTGIADAGVTESGEVIDVEDFNTTSGRYNTVVNRKPVAKPVAFDKDKLEEIANKAIALAKQRGDFAPAFAFANRLEGQERQFVLSRLETARDEVQRQAMIQAEQTPGTESEPNADNHPAVVSEPTA